MEILFTITSIIYLSYFVLFIYGFYNPQKALFWLKINKEKTKNLSHYLNGSLFLVFFITSFIIFEFSGIRAEKEKLDAQLQVQTALEKQKQDEKNKKVEEKEPEKNTSENNKEIKTTTKNINDVEKSKDDFSTKREELKSLKTCENGSLAQTTKELGEWSVDWGNEQNEKFSKRRSQILDKCIQELLTKYKITRQQLSDLEDEDFKNRMKK